MTRTLSTRENEAQFIGALHGFIASVAPDLSVVTEAEIAGTPTFHADLLVAKENDRVVLELKRTLLRSNINNVIAQVTSYMAFGAIRKGIVLYLPAVPGELDVQNVQVGANGQIAVLYPKGLRLPLTSLPPRVDPTR